MYVYFGEVVLFSFLLFDELVFMQILLFCFTDLRAAQRDSMSEPVMIRSTCLPLMHGITIKQLHVIRQVPG